MSFTLCVLYEGHEAEDHVELHVAVEEAVTGVVGYEIHGYSLHWSYIYGVLNKAAESPESGGQAPPSDVLRNDSIECWIRHSILAGPRRSRLGLRLWDTS